MRPDLTGPQETLLATALYDDHCELKVANGSGTLVDLSDRVVTWNWKQPTPDNPIATLSVTLVREFYDPTTSLAPLVGASLLNRLDDDVTYAAQLQGGREVRFRIACVARGAGRPAGAAFVEVFRGNIDRVSWPEEWGDVTFDARDQMGVLYETWTENPAVYPAGSVLEEVMQDILDAEFGAGVYTIEVPVPSGEVTEADFEPDDRVFNVLTELAKKKAWLFQYLYNASGVPELTFFEPDRTIAAPVFTHLLARAIRQLDIDVADIRNVVEGVAYDQHSAELNEKVEDATSILKYGGAIAPGIRRYMRLSVDATQAMTVDQLTAYISAALSDCKDPDAVLKITLPFFWPGEVGKDLYLFPALEQFYDDDQEMAPFTIEHEGHGGGLQQADTIMTVRGKPTAGAKTWTGRRVGAPPSGSPELKEFDVISETATTMTLGWTPSAEITEEFYSVYPVATMAGNPWALARAAAEPLMATDHQLTVTKPPSGWNTLVLVQGRRIHPRTGKVQVLVTWQREVHPGGPQAKIIDVVVTDQSVKATADPNGTQSLLAERIDGGGVWESHVDGSTYTFAVPVPSTETWTIQVTAYAEPVVAVDVDTQSDSRDVLVSNGVGAMPVWETFTVDAPDVGDNVIAVTLEASSGATAHYFALWIKHPTDTSYTEQITPVANTDPDTLTTYDIQLPITEFSYVRTDPGPGNYLVSFNLKVELYENSPSDLLVATEERTLSYYTDGTVLVP